MGRRRVAFILNDLNGGGSELTALNLAARAPRSDCIVIAEWSGGDLEARDHAVPLHFVTAGCKRPPRKQRILGLASKLQELRVNVAVSILSPLVATAAAARVGVPLVHWVQNPLLGSAPPPRFVPGALWKYGFRAIARRAALFAAASPGLLADVHDLGVEPARTAVLPNGVDVNSIRLSERRLGDGPARLINVGRLTPQKRQDVLLEATALVSRQREVALMLVGRGELQDSLQAHARRLGIADQVVFTGFVHNPVELIRESDLFVLSSDYEGFGIVLVEALACGVPVVSTDAPHGPRFVLGSQGPSVLVPCGSPEQLAEGIIEVLDRGPVELSTRCLLRERAARFSLEDVAGRFEELLDQVLDDARGP